MKLHLPKGLRAALIAAIATIGFTLPQAYAATVETTMTTTFSNCAQSDALSVGTANVFGSSDVVTIPEATVASLTKHTNGDTVTIMMTANHAASADATFFSPNINVGNSDSWKLTLNYTNADAIQSISGMTLSVGLFNSSGDWQTTNASWPNGNETFTATVTANGVSKSYTGNLFADGQEHKGQGSTKFAVTLAGDALDLSSATDFSVVIDLPDRTLGAGCFVGLQNIGYSVVATLPEIGEYTWQGTEASHTWSGAVWNDGEASGKTFTDGSDVIFGATGYKEVDVTNSPTARFISVNADGYTFKVEAGQTLSGRTLTIADGCTLTVGGEGALDITGQLAGAGTLALGSSLAPTVSELTIAAGKTFTVSGEGALLSVTTISNAGTLNIGEGARVASSGSIISVGATNPFTVTGLGTLAVDTLRSTGGAINISSNMEISGGDDGKGGTNNSLGLSVTGDNGTVNILAGTTMVTGATYTGNANNMQLNVGTGSENATLVTRRLELGDRNGGTGSFTIGQHGTVVITGNEDFRDGTNPQKNTSLQLSEWNQVVTSNISGKLYARDATAFMSNDASSVINITGGTMAVKGIATTNAASTRAHTLTMTGGKLVMGEMGLAAEAGAWTVSFANAEIGTYSGSTTVGRNFTVSGEVTFNTAAYTWTGENETLELEADTTGGAITVSGNVTGDGTLIVKGTGSVAMTGDNNAITHTIDLQGGGLDVSGAVLDISGISGGSTETTYSDGLVTGNGFATVSGTIDVVKVGAGTTLTHSGVQVLYNGTVLDMNDDGDVVMEGIKSLAVFYVNKDGSTETLSNAVTKGEGQLTTVDLGDNTTLNADSADAVLATLQVRKDASATVALSQDLAVDTITVTTEGKSLTLSGAGMLSAGALQGAGNVVIGTDTTLALNGIGTAYTGSFTANEGGTLQLTTNSLPEILTVNGEGALRMMVSAGGQNIDPQKVEAKNVVLAADEQHNSRFRYVTATDLSGVGHLTFDGGQLWLNNKDMTGDNAFAGTVTFGTTVYSESNAFGGAALRVDRNGTFTGAVEVKENTKFTWGANMTVEFAGAVTGSGNLELARYNGNGTFKISGDASAYAGALTSVANVALSVESNAKLTLAGGSDLSGAVTVGGELTMNSAEGTTSTIGGSISGTGTLNKDGAGTLEVSGAAAATSTVAVNVNGGTLKATVASALGSGAITVADGATLDLVNGGALGATQTVANGGNVLLHSTLTSGTVNGGTLTLAPDFPVDGDILDVDGNETGNGFSQGGTAQVYDTANATLSDDIDIVHGETHYALTDLTDGAITLSGADWNTYQLNGEAQYAVQAIMDYAKENGGELKTISVNDDMLTIENDSTTLKTSMLGGEHLATFAVYMSGTSGLTIDGNCGAAISTNTGAEGTITLETDATVGSIVAGDFENSGAGNLTINGEGRTVKADGAGAAFGGVLALGKGVTLELLHDTSFTTVMNATVKLGESASLVLNEVSFSTVEGGTGATIEVISDEYIPMYAPNIAEYNITGTRIAFNTTAAFDLGHVIDSTSQVVNAGTGSLRDISSNEEYAELNAQGGDIYISTPLESGIETRALIVGDLTLADDRTVAEDTGKTVSITVNGTAGFGSGATVGAALTMAGDSTLDAANPVALANHSLALGTTAGDKLAIGDDLWSTLSDLPALESMDLFTGVSALTLAGSEYKGEVDLTTIFTRDGLKANKYMLSYDTTSKNVVITRQADNNRYWKGGNGTWNYTDKQWMDEETGGSEATFEEGYNAYFTAATGGTVTLGTNITAESITVSGADYTFAPGTYSLTVNKSVEADGHKATFNMALSGTDLKLIAKNGGTISLLNNGSVKDVEVDASSAVSATANLTVTGGFTNAGQVTAGTLTLTQGTTSGGDVNADIVSLATGESYTFGDLTAGIVNGTGANLAIGTGNTLQVNSSATIGNLALANGAQLAGSGTTTVSGTTAINTAATLQFGKLTTGALSGTGTLTLNNGSLTFTEATTLTDTDLAFSGTSTITSQGVTLTFKGTLVHTVKGAMTFVGSFDVGNCKTDDGTATYVEGGSTGNGFKQAQKIVSIINGGSANGTNATLTYNGKSIGPMGTDGKVTFQGDTEYDKYYVNSGTEKATTALNNEKQQLGTFELKGGTTLVVDKNISMGMVNAAGAATLQIDSGKTVTTDGTTKALTLTGAGTLAVDAGKTATGVTLGNTWTGTVSFTEAGLNTLDAAWGNANSTVALQDTYGSLGTAEIDYDLELRKGTGSNWGFGVTSPDAGMVTLYGNVKGAGDFGVKAGTGSSIFILKGSTGDWTGNFVDNSAAGGSTTLVLDSAEKVIRGMVGAVSPGGELSYASNLEVTTVANTTFEKAVQVARLISMSGTTKLQENSTVGTLSNTANLELAANKTLTIREQLSYGTSSGIFKMGAHSQVALAENATMGYLGDYDACYQGGTVTNGTNEQQTFGLDNKNITVDGATIMLTGRAVTVNNVLTNAKADTLAVEQGDVSLNNVADPLTVGTSLSIGASKTFKVANTDGAAKQTVVMGANSTLTTGNGSALDANLTLAAGVTTDMAAELAMNGGALTLNKGLSLVGGLYDAVDALSEAGAYVNLFTGVGALTLGTDTYTEPVKALQYFTNLKDFSDRGDYYLQYDGGIVSIYFTPTDARTLTWNGTEGNSTWEVGEGTAENWLDTTLADTHFASGDNARFTGDAEKKLVTIAEDITARNITVSDSRYTIENDADRTITADQFAVNNAALGKKGAGKLVLDVATAVSLENGAFAVQAGDVEIGAADSAGAIDMVGSMLDIAPGSTLTVATITADEDSTIELDGTLQVAKGSVMYIEASEGSLLKIADVGTATAGTLTVGADAYLYGLENHGTLDLGTNELTLMKKTAQGGNVTAAKITLAETGSTFGDLAVNTIQYGLKAADDATLDAENPNLVVDSIAAGGVFPVVTLDISETMHGEGALAPIQRTGEEVTYTLLHANDGLGSTGFTLNAGALDLLKQNGLLHADAGLVKTENDVTLTVGGLDLTWYTDKDVTEWGYNVVSNDSITHGGNTLNGVEHVVVDASRVIDVTGAGSEPGLRVRNITGLDGRTLAFTGTEDDTVNLVTNEETSSNVGLAAENITLKVGLDELDEMDPVDYKDLRVGDVTLTGATLDVHAHEGLDDSFTVNALHGDSGSMLKGTLIVEGQGGDYSGEYEDATVILHENADQTLAADEGLTVMGLGLARITYSGTQTHMDGIEGIGLRVMLNDTTTDNSHRTLTLDNEYSYISNGAVGVGLSAIETAGTLDTSAAPNLLEAEHLDMSGSTLFIYQASADGDTLVMDVNDGGYKRGLLLANFGAEDTTADVQLQGNLFFKYYQNPRLESGEVLVDRRTDYFTLVTSPTSVNGRAGAGMLDDALLHNNPQVTNPDGDLATVMTALEQGGYSRGNADRVMAAMSGASQAAMGAAWNHDVDRQLRAIRNRTTQMGLAECTKHEGLPYFNAWINAEGDYRKLSADGTLAGYKLTSWGGTVGVDVDCTNRLTLGLAVTAMSGDFTAESADHAEGDLDRMYVSVFGRYTHRAWTHTFVATLGLADTKLNRTVDYGYGNYDTSIDSDGKAFGIMYELGYVAALNDDASTCIQPLVNISYRTSSLDGGTERSKSDAALKLGEAKASVFTVAAGARLQSTIGTSVYNRATLFEGRVLLKADAGDRDTDASNGFVGVPAKRKPQSAKMGAFGVEVGAGITIPLSENAGALFLDFTGDFRDKYTEVNGTVGYRFNF